MKSLNAKEMVTAQDYYFLSIEDFRPIRVGDDSRLRNNCIALGNMRENGALFETQEDAINASKAIRAYLLGSKLSRQSTQQPQSLAGTTQEAKTQKPRSLLEETLACIGKHNKSDICGQIHSEPQSQGFVLIKILHS